MRKTTFHRKPIRRWHFLGAPLLAASVIAGCLGTHRIEPVDAPRGREALKTALEGWKKGGAPAALLNETPPITVQDWDWQAGERLVDYELDGADKPIEANLYVPVQLTLRNARGKQVTKKVRYIIATSPIVTVFREVR